MRFWEKYKKRLCGGVFIQSKVKVGEYQEIWRSCLFLDEILSLLNLTIW